MDTRAIRRFPQGDSHVILHGSESMWDLLK